MARLEITKRRKIIGAHIMAKAAKRNGGVSAAISNDGERKWRKT